ncbi:hypothetical protein [Streptomyces sp. AC627_RSS907]|uniref:hypothetical protein n=1 Tax=Streptomyces sp. AC627_RSS907 TaxID=2823684 RepID=UPI0020B8ACE6|nr:hypothetical protein [Streptomyces sp. AC627_RSS907]
MEALGGPPNSNSTTKQRSIRYWLEPTPRFSSGSPRFCPIVPLLSAMGAPRNCYERIRAPVGTRLAEGLEVLFRHCAEFLDGLREQANRLIERSMGEWQRVSQGEVPEG